MLFKLAFSSIRHRWKDYLLLFSGLVISSAIFYVFETLAANESFLKMNGQSVSGMIGYVFSFGSVLLGLLTLIYLNYANSFLLGMRQRDYGLFIMLGTRKSRIGRLIWLETMLLGLTATVLGIVVGLGLSQALSSLIISFLGTAAKSYQVWWLPAVSWTLLVYLGLFFLAAGWNTIVMTKKPVLQLLKADRQADLRQSKPLMLVLQLIAGILLLAVGYYVMAKPMMYRQYTVLIALITLTGGTYFLFKAVIVSFLNWLAKRSFAQKGLNGFTLAQLRFRVADYTKVLTGITMMFAMALGAITVGIGLYQTIENNARLTGAYDLRIVDPTAQQQRLIKKLPLQQKNSYTFFKQGNRLIFTAQQFNQQPFERIQMQQNAADAKIKKVSGGNPELLTTELKSYLTETASGLGKRTDQVVVESSPAVGGTRHQVIFLRANGFNQNAAIFKKLAKSEQQKTPAAQRANLWLGAWTGYLQLKTLYSGLEFMAVLLGISFLAMLASCLMFKILSGSFADIPRYQLLRKLGSHESSLHWAVRREISILFVLPAILGVTHVLFGLKLFKSILNNPYQQLWLPFGIFGVIYLAYYGFLSFVYQRIVLKREIDK